MKKIYTFVFLLVSLLSYAGDRHVIIDKTTYKLWVIEGSDTIFTAPVCVGKNLGQKTRSGDCKTPEGQFSISQIQDSRYWTHDFHDGKGERKGAYGPWFIRLKMPRWTSIGIHGTCFPNSIGTRDSEGCIRLLNDDLVEFRKLIEIGTPVEILPDNVN